MRNSTTNTDLKRVAILGTRGIPAQHGGFETFAERLAVYLASNGWQVTVACQSDPPGIDSWKGVRRVKFGSGMANPLGTVFFDARSILRAMFWRDPVLVLGYNTAIFWVLLRIAGVAVVANMDGLEWARAKWPRFARWFLRFNEWVAGHVANHLVADHPEIAARLARLYAPDHVTMIPYGGDRVERTDPTVLEKFNLRAKGYALVIARPEPENSILEIVTAYSRSPRGALLVVLGRLDPANSYHRLVRAAAGPEVVFLGTIYDAEVVPALRKHARLYIHGHTVGGTNPSFVEALASGCPALAHDNAFNRWVGGPGALYFKDTEDCALVLDEILDAEAQLQAMSKLALERAEEEFRWEPILISYARLMTRFQAEPRSAPSGAKPEETNPSEDPSPRLPRRVGG
jgi:glycosyltransferase involved in cell wall biosynthesis